MGKPVEQRTYKKRLLMERGSKSEQAVREAKNSRCKERNKANKQFRREEAEERNANWQSLTPMEQLRDLDRRLGIGKGAKKQRKKIMEKIVPIEEKQST